ncbi:hypothetical protein IV203_010602 [Nitzschia inconspicua]|uniref:Uncharacterized protein n=1 Tax=Nitzschia inconspicua TaxID=303405 RepID=A0A9K3KWK2_9STRA|nr:hypothetical protein IV203_010602 [Nitzschia inconspicua]
MASVSRNDVSNSNILWFTSTQSWKLQSSEGLALSGLYMCENLSAETGQCSEAKLIVDTIESPLVPTNNRGSLEHAIQHRQHNHLQHRGLDLMNVQIDYASNTLFTGYFEKNRNSFEILSAPLVAPVSLQPYFRTEIFSSNNGCKMSCCEDATHTYFKVQPRDFAVDNGNVFVSWDAFYQDCGNVYTKKTGLKWTVGVSKLLQTNECLHTTDEVSFAGCTEPVAIAFQDSKPREKLLGYSGFSIANIPNSDKKLFFLSALDRPDVNVLNNELWVLKEGEFNPYPDVFQVHSTARIDSRFADVAVDDVGTIRLRKDENGVPTGLCRTAYDTAIVCHKIQVQDDGKVDFLSANTFVTKHTVSESCTVLKVDHHPATKLISSVTTGLEVFWSDDAPDDDPEYVIFGCYGEINFSGNITTAFRDGRRTVQTIAGAYPGSIVKGMDLQRDANRDFDISSMSAPSHESLANLKKHQHPATTVPSPAPSFKIYQCESVLFSILLIATAVFVFKRKSITGSRDKGVEHDYNQVTQLEIGAISNISYVELTGPLCP